LRLVFALLFLLPHGIGLPLYIILWIVMPQEPALAPRYDVYTGQPLQ
jgi:phage shock protein PspC (stress-responsive transcriptional regulator)